MKINENVMKKECIESDFNSLKDWQLIKTKSVWHECEVFISDWVWKWTSLCSLLIRDETLKEFTKWWSLLPINLLKVLNNSVHCNGGSFLCGGDGTAAEKVDSKCMRWSWFMWALLLSLLVMSERTKLLFSLTRTKNWKGQRQRNTTFEKVYVRCLQWMGWLFELQLENCWVAGFWSGSERRIGWESMNVTFYLVEFQVWEDNSWHRRINHCSSEVYVRSQQSLSPIHTQLKWFQSLILAFEFFLNCRVWTFNKRNSGLKDGGNYTSTYISVIQFFCTQGYNLNYVLKWKCEHSVVARRCGHVCRKTWKVQKTSFFS